MDHTTHHRNPFLSPLLLSVGAAGAITYSPYLLPHIGIGTAALTHEVVNGLCGAPASTGLAGIMSGALAHVPLIGQSLVAGGLSTALWSGGIGIGGLLLSKFVERFEAPGTHGWCPSKIIRWAAVGTSILIALPAILTGLSVGLTFLASAAGMGLFGTAALGSVTQTFLAGTLGSLSSTGFAATGAGLATLTASHLLTCGVALFPAGLSAIFARKDDANMLASGAPDTISSNERYSCELISHSACNQGAPCQLDFSIVDKTTGKTLSPDELATIHTKKLHTMIVDSGLSDYHHIHPTYDASRKVFTCSFTPNLQASYAMWNDFTVQGEQQPTQVKTAISISRGMPLLPRIVHSSAVQMGDERIHISSNGPLRAGQPAMLTVSITGPDGRPVTNLEPIMGAYAHLAGFSSDGQHFIHSHPLGVEPQTQTQRGLGELQFHLTPGPEGMSKFFLQIQQEGRILTISFGQAVAPALTYSNRVESQAHSHAAMHMA